MSARVTVASARDIDELAALAAHTFPLACPPELSASAVQSYIRDNLSQDCFRDLLEEPDCDLLCARSETDTLVGYALLVAGIAMDPTCARHIHHHPTLGVSKLYVAPQEHGSGVAADLQSAIEGLAADRGARSLWLATNKANIRARTFYLKNGYVERGERIFLVGGVPNLDIVYEKEL